MEITELLKKLETMAEYNYDAVLVIPNNYHYDVVQMIADILYEHDYKIVSKEGQKSEYGIFYKTYYFTDLSLDEDVPNCRRTISMNIRINMPKGKRRKLDTHRYGSIQSINLKFMNGSFIDTFTITINALIKSNYINKYKTNFKNFIENIHKDGDDCACSRDFNDLLYYMFLNKDFDELVSIMKNPELPKEERKLIAMAITSKLGYNYLGCIRNVEGLGFFYYLSLTENYSLPVLYRNVVTSPLFMNILFTNKFILTSSNSINDTISDNRIFHYRNISEMEKFVKHIIKKKTNQNVAQERLIWK